MMKLGMAGFLAGLVVLAVSGRAFAGTVTVLELTPVNSSSTLNYNGAIVSVSGGYTLQGEGTPAKPVVLPTFALGTVDIAFSGLAANGGAGGRLHHAIARGWGILHI